MKILIVDDHAMVRQAISALLEQVIPDVEMLQAADSADALEIAGRHDDLDAVFLDLAMPGMGGMAALETFGRSWPQLPVIVLTAAADPQLAQQAFAAGALGYVPKSATSETLLAALRLVLQGEIFVPSLMVRGPGAMAFGHVPVGAMTARQVEVLRSLEEGLSNKQIARRLDLSEKTVKGHVAGVFRALSVTGRQEAILAARVHKLI